MTFSRSKTLLYMSRGSDHAIILLFKRNSPINTHFEALEPHFQVPKCRCKAPAVLITRNSHLCQPICALYPLRRAFLSSLSQMTGCRQPHSPSTYHPGKAKPSSPIHQSSLYRLRNYITLFSLDHLTPAAYSTLEAST